IWTTPEAWLWVEKKRDDLTKRGAIEEIEQKIELYPEEPETPARLFKLARLVEGRDDMKYRAQDLFYEITLVYPHSEFFRESKIRADNTRAVKAVSELSDMLKKGAKGGDGEEILLERARIYADSLKDPAKAREDYEALLKLYPNSPRRDEAWLGLGEMALSQDRDASAALLLWEAGLAACTDPAGRNELAKKINGLGQFRERVLYSEKRSDHDAAEQQIWRIWRIEKDPDYALGLLQEALNRIENRPHAARLQYLAGRLLEEAGNDVGALEMYQKAWESLYHPGCRKDIVIYRMARIQARRGQADEARRLYAALVNRYPRSRLSRSGYYWLYKNDLAAGNLAQAHERLSRLLAFRQLAPSHRAAIQALEKNVAAQLDIAQMERLRSYSKQGGSEFPYYIGKVLENDLRDIDRAIAQYEAYLRTHPNMSRSRDLMLKIAALYERKGNAVKAVSVLDDYLKTVEPNARNLDLLIRIGDLVEDKLANQELARVFWESVLDEYRGIREVCDFAKAKLKRLVEKRMAKAEKPARRAVKRIYSDDDKDILESLKEIKERFVDDLGDYPRAEREMVQLWDENPDSPATLDIMKELVALCENQLMDPDKAAEYEERWLSENKGDALYGEYVMKLYDLYMDKIRDGQKALRLLETFTREAPSSPYADEANLKLGKANELLVRNWDEARRIYQRIIDTKKNDPIVHEAYFRMGNVMRDGFANYIDAIRFWEELNGQYYNNQFAAEAQYAVAYTYE
ncbi:MAG TPA: tetratricopeptide repeat protein, partial [Candidatus Ozemobacteraceae bacterium]|nr:tetratricopeptide repeat protein [Candidatus Ozemobacteraceae bacterium]